MYDTPEALLNEIRAGEDSLLDLKEVLFKGEQIQFARGEGRAQAELAKDLSCFANTAGGVLVFGVRDDGTVTGIPPERMDALRQLALHAALDSVEPPLGHLLVFDRVLLPDAAGVLRLCLKLEVRRARFNVHAPKSRRAFRRIDDACVEMSMEEQARLFEQRGMLMAFEERPVFGAELDDLDMGGVDDWLQRTGQPALAASALPAERRLQNLKFAMKDESGALHPSALGLLLFCREPDAHLPGAFVDVTAYAGTRNDAAERRDAKKFAGPLVRQIESTMTYLRQSPLVPVRSVRDDVGRLDVPAYSLVALQEAVVNALVHRDYAIRGSQVRVMLFTDRVEVWSPGRLVNTLTPEDLFNGCQPVRRNQLLAGCLRHYPSGLTNRAYMSGQGDGFLTMVRECERVAGRPPAVEIVGDAVKVAIPSGAP